MLPDLAGTGFRSKYRFPDLRQDSDGLTRIHIRKRPEAWRLCAQKGLDIANSRGRVQQFLSSACRVLLIEQITAPRP
jgi:hypothetical protein